MVDSRAGRLGFILTVKKAIVDVMNFSIFETIIWEFVDFKPSASEYECNDSGIIILKKYIHPGIFKRLFGKKVKTEIVRFVGSGTIWHVLPDLERQDSFRERMLYDYWRRWKYENKGRI